MKTKFNKEAGRWGVWVIGLSLWLVRQTEPTIEPYKFKSKQEAQAHIDGLND